eukprot:gene15614-17506_t
MINHELFQVSGAGMLVGVSKDVYEASKHLLKKLEEIENATLDSFTHFVHNVNEGDLMKLMKTTHLNPTMFKQFEEKFTIISQYQDSGDHLLLLHEDKGDFKYSKAIVILHFTVKKEQEEKRFSCSFYALNYEAKPSLAKIAVGMSGTVGLFFLNPLLSVVGVAVTALYFAKVDISSNIRKALDLYLVQRLINTGHIIDEGTKFMLQVPKLGLHRR